MSLKTRSSVLVLAFAACSSLVAPGCELDQSATAEVASEVVIDPLSACSSSLINSSLAGGSVVHILEGICVLDAPIVIPSGGRLYGAGRGLTTLIPTWAPQGGPDDPHNSVIRIAGDIGAQLTTTSTSLPKDSIHINLAAPVTVDDDEWLMVSAWNSSDDEYRMSDGNDVILTEMMRPTTTGTSNGFDLAFSTFQHHRAGAVVRKVTPVTDVHVEGFDIHADGGAFATGIEVNAASGVEIEDVSGAGMARSMIDLAPGSRQIRIQDIRSRGENNSIVLARSAMDIVIDGVDSTADGKRSHALGVPRALLTFSNRTTSAIITNAVLQNGATGIRTWGGHHLHFSNIIVRDMDAALQNLDPDIKGGISGACVDGGAGPLHIAEFSLDVSFSDIHLEDCRQPNPPSWFTPISWYLHDMFEATLSGITIVNKGLSPNTYAMGGMLIADATGTIESLYVSGVNFAFQTRATSAFDVNELRIDGAPGAGGSAVGAVYFNHTAGGGPQINRLHISNMGGHVRFGPDFRGNPDWDLRIAELRSDAGQPTRTERNLVIALNGNPIKTTADYLYRGDVVTLSKDGVKLIAKTPVGPSTANGTVVTGAPGDYGFDYVMVASLPSSLNYVTCDAGAVVVGDLLVAGPGKRAVVNNSPANPFFVLGKAMDAKPAGAEGLVRVDIP